MYNPTFTGFSRTLPWLALTVKARHEQVVREALEMRGFEGYAPTCKSSGAGPIGFKRWKLRSLPDMSSVVGLLAAALRY